MSTQSRIKELLNTQNKTITDLSKAISKERTTVYRYLSGAIKNMPIEIIKEIASYLNTTPSYLLEWTEDPNDYEKLYNELTENMSDDYLPELDDDERKKQFVLHHFNKLLEDPSVDYFDIGSSLTELGFSKDEITLFTIFRNLNKTSKKKILEYAKDQEALQNK